MLLVVSSYHLTHFLLLHKKKREAICFGFLSETTFSVAFLPMEISDEQRMEMSTMERQHHLPPSWQGNGDADVEVEVEEDHLWPTKDGPLPIFLKFENVEYRVKMTLKNPLTAARVAFASQMRVDQGSSCKHILKGIAGSVDPGEILALMGPSGSGKTTLLKILGGRLGGGVKGQITYNDTPYSPCLKRRIGFVTQDDVLFPQLTVEETLVFAAFLRLPACMSKQQKRDRVDAIITELNLERWNLNLSHVCSIHGDGLSCDRSSFGCMVDQVPAHQDRGSVREGGVGRREEEDQHRERDPRGPVAAAPRRAHLWPRLHVGEQAHPHPPAPRQDAQDDHHDDPPAVEPDVPHVRQAAAHLRRARHLPRQGPGLHAPLLLAGLRPGDPHEPGRVPAGPRHRQPGRHQRPGGAARRLAGPARVQVPGHPAPAAQVPRQRRRRRDAHGAAAAGGARAQGPGPGPGRPPRHRVAPAVRGAVPAHVPGARARLPGQDAAGAGRGRGAAAGPPVVEVGDGDGGAAAGPGGAHLLHLHLLDVVVAVRLRLRVPLREAVPGEGAQGGHVPAERLLRQQHAVRRRAARRVPGALHRRPLLHGGPPTHRALLRPHAPRHAARRLHQPGHRRAARRRHPQRQEGRRHGLARAHALPPHRRLLRPAHPRVHPLAQVRLLHALRVQPAAQGAVPRPPHLQLRQPGRMPAPAVVAVLRHRRPRRRHARGLDPARHGARLPTPRLLLPAQTDQPHALVNCDRSPTHLCSDRFRSYINY